MPYYSTPGNLLGTEIASAVCSYQSLSCRHMLNPTVASSAQLTSAVTLLHLHPPCG
jgi:hypothetical protein